MIFFTRLIFLRFIACAIMMVSAGTSDAQIPAIRLDAIAPTAAGIGSTVDARVTAGANLDGLTQIRFSHPGIIARLNAPAETEPTWREPTWQDARFTVTVADNVPAGVYDVRIAGRLGVSNPRRFVVHSSPTGTPLFITPPASRRAATTPHRFESGQIIDANVSAGAIDHYQIPLHQGKPVAVRLLAQLIDSPLIGSVTVRDPDGNRVHAVRGAEGIDPRGQFVPASDGVYSISVSDFLYRGGPDFQYQLWVEPVDAIQPAPTNVPALARVTFLDREAFLPSSATLPDDRATDDRVTMTETESADSIMLPLDPAANVRQSVVVAGIFDSPDDRDAYEFSAEKGKPLWVEVVSDRLGEPTDARVRIERAEPTKVDGEPKISWSQVAVFDDSQSVGGASMRMHSNDPAALFTPPDSGTYRLIVRDLDRGVSLSATQRYRLIVRTPRPGFNLLAYRVFPGQDASTARNHGAHLIRGGSVALGVLAVRHDGFAGEIRIGTRDLPAGLSCPPAVIGRGQTKTQISVTAADDAPAAITTVKIIGEADLDDQVVSVGAAPATIVIGAGSGRQAIRSRRCENLEIAVSQTDTMPLSLRFADAAEIKIARGGSAELAFTLRRLGGGNAACVVRARDLPTGISIADVTVPADKVDGKLTIKATDKATVGPHTFCLQTETKVKLKLNPQRLARATTTRDAIKQKLASATAAGRPAIEAELKLVQQFVDAAKPAAQPKEYAVFLAAPHRTIRISDNK